MFPTFILPKSQRVLLARACLIVLLQLDGRIDNTAMKDFPLASSAAQHWVDHAQFENISSDIRDGIECPFLTRTNRTLPPGSGCTISEQPDATPLYYAALCGFLDLTERLVVPRYLKEVFTGVAIPGSMPDTM